MCCTERYAAVDHRRVGTPADVYNRPSPADPEVVIRRLFGTAIVVALALGGCTDGRQLPDLDVAAAASGASAPDDVLVDGGWPEVAAFVEESAAAGQGTVVNLFASWCRPCEREMPILLEASRQTSGVRWLGVASEDRRKDAEPFVERLGITWTSVLDSTATTHIALESVAMPTTAFFGADGELRSVVIGELDEEQLVAELAGIVP